MLRPRGIFLNEIVVCRFYLSLQRGTLELTRQVLFASVLGRTGPGAGWFCSRWMVVVKRGVMMRALVCYLAQRI